MKIFNIKRKCKHDFKIAIKSNAIQLDEMGYPLRLFICKCTLCGETVQRWIDVNKKECDELDNGKSFILTWEE